MISLGRRVCWFYCSRKALRWTYCGCSCWINNHILLPPYHHLCPLVLLSCFASTVWSVNDRINITIKRVFNGPTPGVLPRGRWRWSVCNKAVDPDGRDDDSFSYRYIPPLILGKYCPRILCQQYCEVTNFVRSVDVDCSLLCMATVGRELKKFHFVRGDLISTSALYFLTHFK